jgi:hypothetical protein
MAADAVTRKVPVPLMSLTSTVPAEAAADWVTPSATSPAAA